ncbi:MAG: ABC transporter permease, partial [Pararhodobacter sp.]
MTTSDKTGFRGWLQAPVPATATQARVQQFWLGWKRFAANRSALGGAIFLLILVLVAWLAPLISPYSPFQQSLSTRLLPPSAAHWLGTDELGRDILSRIIYGTRITLYIAVLTAVIVAPVGLIVGTLAGYFGGWLDLVLMRIV